MTDWTIETETPFDEFYNGLEEYKQAVLRAAVETVLQEHGIDICSSGWGKSLGEGLYEFRVRKSLKSILSAANLEVPDSFAAPDRTVLLRVFCTFHGKRIVLLLNGYDKERDSSAKRQNREIAAARKQMKAWKEQQN